MTTKNQIQMINTKINTLYDQIKEIQFVVDQMKNIQNKQGIQIHELRTSQLSKSS